MFSVETFWFFLICFRSWTLAMLNLPVLFSFSFSTRLLLLAGVMASVCWSIADMLLVGLAVDPERYPLFSRTLVSAFGEDLDIALLMLGASGQRLFWGVLPATFSLVFYIIAAAGVYRLMKPGKTAALCFLTLLSGYTLYPLAHAGFYYVGMSAQTLLNAPHQAHKLLLEQFSSFHTMLAVHWMVAVRVSAAGWLLLGIQTLRGGTFLPRFAVCFNPLPVGVLIGGLCSLFPQSAAAAMIGGATFSLAQGIFFASSIYFSAAGRLP